MAYTFSEIPVKISTGFFVAVAKIFKHMWKYKGLKIGETILKMNKVEDHTT